MNGEMINGYYFFFVITFPLIIIYGFSSVNYKLKKHMENQERIIERLDLLINKKEMTNNNWWSLGAAKGELDLILLCDAEGE